MSSTSLPKVSPPAAAAPEAANQLLQQLSNLPNNRFELELEFLQSLASPQYLHHLATNDYLRDESFLQFLEYLKYWKRPEYAKYITYPHSLYFLDLLCENETFRNELVNVGFRDFVHQQQFRNWQYRSKIVYGTGTQGTKSDGDAENEAEKS
mmetsp:Transcript_5200/g.6708  ORF Transcript_5200/g.6708 Transcript_5200/m.6708 type:complete len:152 (-) Transcript_5200:1630-2085(-)